MKRHFLINLKIISVLYVIVNFEAYNTADDESIEDSVGSSTMTTVCLFIFSIK